MVSLLPHGTVDYSVLERDDYSVLEGDDYSVLEGDDYSVLEDISVGVGALPEPDFSIIGQDGRGVVSINGGD